MSYPLLDFFKSSGVSRLSPVAASVPPICLYALLQMLLRKQGLFGR